jgi:hypothetical protein
VQVVAHLQALRGDREQLEDPGGGERRRQDRRGRLAQPDEPFDRCRVVRAEPGGHPGPLVDRRVGAVAAWRVVDHQHRC